MSKEGNKTREQIERIYGDEIFSLLNKAFQALPVCAIVESAGKRERER
jgi:hypothetical protein